jgi:hypothetical protein
MCTKKKVMPFLAVEKRVVTLAPKRENQKKLLCKGRIKRKKITGKNKTRPRVSTYLPFNLYYQLFFILF